MKPKNRRIIAVVRCVGGQRHKVVLHENGKVTCPHHPKIHADKEQAFQGLGGEVRCLEIQKLVAELKADKDRVWWNRALPKHFSTSLSRGFDNAYEAYQQGLNSRKEAVKKKAANAQAKVNEWNRKLKMAKSKVRMWQRKVKYYQSTGVLPEAE